MKVRHFLCVILSGLFLLTSKAHTQSLDESAFEIGNINVTDYYVDPAAGNDDNSGTSSSNPKRTVTDIWNSIPSSSNLSQGYRINLLPGNYGTNHLPNYWELKKGTATAPIIIQAANGYGTVNFTRDINMAGVSYFYLIGVDIKNKLDDGFGDAFHCEQCDHILLRTNSFNGAPSGRNAGGGVAHETIKFNQSQYVYIENNNIQGADDNAIDWVSVQYGHIIGNRIHDSQGWCTYVKGGSSYILIEANIAYNCGEGGITAGQGTGLEFMDSPWLRFEANYVKIVNNIIYNIDGAALGVNGGYGILIAHNTAYKVGNRSHLLEVVFGERSCDGSSSACTQRVNAGAWGPTAIGSDNAQPIGNQDIIIFNNVLYNPSGSASGSQHFAIYGPRTPSAAGIPSPQKTDSGLLIKGNVVWNGTNSMPIGVEEGDQGCQSGNPTCTLSQLSADNTINSSEPDFISANTEDFRPQASGILAGISSLSIPNIPTLDSGLNPIPEGNTSNVMVREFSGVAVTSRPPGAIAGASSSISFPGSTPGGTTPGNGSGQGPSVKIKSAKGIKSGKKVKFEFTVTATDSDGVGTVQARIMTAGTEIGSVNLKLKKGKYTGKKSVKTSAKNFTVSIMAADSGNFATTATKNFKAKSAS